MMTPSSAGGLAHLSSLARRHPRGARETSRPGGQDGRAFDCLRRFGCRRGGPALTCGAPEVSMCFLFALDEEVWGYADAAGKAKGGANDDDRAMHHSQWRLPAPSVDYCYPRTCLTPALACSLRPLRIITNGVKDCEKLLARRACHWLPGTDTPPFAFRLWPASLTPLASARAASLAAAPFGLADARDAIATACLVGRLALTATLGTLRKAAWPCACIHRMRASSFTNAGGML